MDDIHTEYIWIIQPPLHSPQLLLQFLARVLLPALGQVRLELLLEVLLGLNHQLLQQLLQLVDESLLAGECEPLAFTQDVREYEGAIVLLTTNIVGLHGTDTFLITEHSYVQIIKQSCQHQ